MLGEGTEAGCSARKPVCAMVASSSWGEAVLSHRSAQVYPARLPCILSLPLLFVLSHTFFSACRAAQLKAMCLPITSP